MYMPGLRLRRWGMMWWGSNEAENNVSLFRIIWYYELANAILQCMIKEKRKEQHYEEITQPIVVIRVRVLNWLQLSLIVLIVASLVLVVLVNPPGSLQRDVYGKLIGGIIALMCTAWVFNRIGRYTISAVLTVLCAIIGPWGSFLFDPNVSYGDLLPLTYVSISVLLASILVSPRITLGVAIFQLIVLIGVLVSIPGIKSSNWPSLLAFICIISVLSITASYIIQRYLQQLLDYSIRDHLTDLFNKRYFEATLKDEMRRAENKNLEIGLIMIDIDGFKQFNDQYGHQVGDKILQLIGQNFVEQVNLPDTVCRYGGDEFVIIVPNCTTSSITQLAEQLRVSTKTLTLPHQGVDITDLAISLGIAMFPHHGISFADLLAAADTALYQAKQGGRNRKVLYDMLKG